MKIDVSKLRDLKPGVYKEELTFDEEKYPLTFPILSLKKIEAEVTASKYEDFVDVNIFVNGIVVLASSYTLKPFDFNLRTSEEYHFATSKEEDDEDLTLYKGNVIDMDCYIFNLICASIPLSAHAKGETLPKSGDGYRVLTEEEVKKEKANKTDSRFSKLDEIDFDN